MIICEKCFCDTEIISVIKNKSVIGDCPLCKSKNVYLYDTDEFDDLSMMFDDLLSIYASFFITHIVSKSRYTIVEKRADLQLEHI